MSDERVLLSIRHDAETGIHSVILPGRGLVQMTEEVFGAWPAASKWYPRAAPEHPNEHLMPVLAKALSESTRLRQMG